MTASLRWKGYIAKCIALGEDYNNFMAQIAVLAICHLDHSQSSIMLHVLIFMHGLSKYAYSNSPHIDFQLDKILVACGTFLSLDSHIIFFFYEICGKERK